MDRAKRIYDQLSALGAPITKDDLVNHILRGLGSNYRPFTRNIESQLTAISFDNLFGLLLSEELQLQSSIDSLNPPAVAHFTRHTITGGYRGRGRSNRRGGSQSTSGRGRSTSTNRDPSSLTCYNCGGQGHTSRQCPSPKFNNTSDYHSKPMSNYTSSPNASKPWVVDSGSTHHLTSEMENLGIHSEYSSTDEVTLTNGKSLPITHIGSNHITLDSHRFSLNNILHVPQSNTNLIFVLKFTTANDVFIEFFPSYFIIKDLKTKQLLHRGYIKD
ncbi:hypothetical protein K2173_017098 [Erythroxylum novogranatense]|uniref:CCHC-type domain-containing protein n=1 Tax=Erythroxylum novogranatense TaxID=1862640 RepID=A0AAV8U5P5_9ROSI|nr:hypothetical protein K2173_017098 [Erythroxylum novogranatense]